jgi:hypothetical protein
MIRKLALAACLAFASPALAGPEEPVKAIMDVAQSAWSDNPSENSDYFDATRLNSLYTKAFADAYRAAAKYPVYDEGGGPFGYDVITNGQDGCPLKEVTVTPGATTSGVTDVKVTFKLWTCVADGEIDKNQVSELHFDVVMENGRPVIADIHRTIDGGRDSLVKEMLEIAKTGAEAPPADPQP